MRTRMIPVPLALALAFAPVAFGTASCACGSSSTASATPSSSAGCKSPSKIQPCSPQAVGESTMGRIAVAQAGPQQTVIWQVKASRAAGVYTTTIMIGSITIYGPNTQAYPPHGSFPTGNPAGLPSGAVFKITGTFAPPKDDVEEFYFQCLLA